jgi:sugar O-acyltransferase (sialic acid O-acetyltransferase NeuD family)
VLGRIAIIGAGGHAKEILQIVLDSNAVSATWEISGFIIIGDFHAPERLMGYPVHRGVRWIEENPDVHLIVGVGNPAARQKLAKIISEFHNKWATLIHPRAWVGDDVILGPGSIIFAGALVNTDVRIGDHVHVNLNCTISHDSTLGNYVTLGPGVCVSGNVQLADGVECGAGVILIPREAVGAWSVVGAGTVVTKSLPSNVTAIGAPARIIKTRVPGWHET